MINYTTYGIHQIVYYLVGQHNIRLSDHFRYSAV